MPFLLESLVELGYKLVTLLCKLLGEGEREAYLKCVHQFATPFLYNFSFCGMVERGIFGLGVTNL